MPIRKNVPDIRTLSLHLAKELNSMAFDLASKGLDSSTDTITLIDCIGSILEELQADTCKFYQQKLNELDDEFGQIT